MRSMSTARSLIPAERILLGPGPSPVPQRVLRAMAAPTLGHLDPQYLAIRRDLRDAPSRFWNAQSTHVSRERDGHGGDGMRGGEPD